MACHNNVILSPSNDLDDDIDTIVKSTGLSRVLILIGMVVVCCVVGVNEIPYNFVD